MRRKDGKKENEKRKGNGLEKGELEQGGTWNKKGIFFYCSCNSVKHKECMGREKKWRKQKRNRDNGVRGSVKG